MNECPGPIPKIPTRGDPSMQIKWSPAEGEESKAAKWSQEVRKCSTCNTYCRSDAVVVETF